MQSKGMGFDASCDVVQESFLRLWKNCANVEEEKAKSFLFKVAGNLFIDEKRKEQTRIRLAPVNVNSKESSDPQFALEEKEFKQKLEDCLNSMTQASKEVFVMHRFDGMTYKEIAGALEISVKAVEKRMSKGLKHLLKQNINIKR